MDEFLKRVDEHHGDYLIAAPYSLAMEWALTRIIGSEPRPRMRYDRGLAEWPNGSRGFFRSLSRSDTLNSLAGMQLDGALLVFGDPHRKFPTGLDEYLNHLSAGPHFAVWEVKW